MSHDAHPPPPPSSGATGTTVGGHIGRCDFTRHAPIVPLRISTTSRSDADRFSEGLTNEYERAA